MFFCLILKICLQKGKTINEHFTVQKCDQYFEKKHHQRILRTTGLLHSFSAISIQSLSEHQNLQSPH